MREILLIALYAFCLCTARAKKIKTNQGWLVGTEEYSQNGRKYFAFRKIPFAIPPTGELRFRPPKALEKWSDILDATKEGELCAQAALGFDEGEEDCLHLSVYTPKIPQATESRLPVLVWLPGGSFMTGGAKEYSPHLLMDRDVVLVIPQYRLGVLGFYSSNTEFTPGNYGLLDQVEALKWVKNNVHYFGGDPTEVTLGGDCAGGVSAVLHMLSPLSEELFHRVITLSGSPLSTWAIHPKHNRFGLALSNELGCPPHDFELLSECFRKKPLKELLQAQKELLEAMDPLIGNRKLAPVVQKPSFAKTSPIFLGEHPLKLLMEAKFVKVPVLMSVTKDVGSYLVDMALYEFMLEKIEEIPDFLKKLIASLVKEIGIADHEKESKNFKDYYLPQWKYDNIDNAVKGLSQMFGDGFYNVPLLTLAKLLSKSVDVRFMRFEYEGGPKLYDMRHSESEKMPPFLSTAVSHGDELFFLFPYKRYNLTDEHVKVVNLMLDTVDDFVHGRVPTANWPLFTSKGLEINAIDAHGKLRTGIPFTSKHNENFFKYIFRSQNKKILEVIEKEKNINISRWIHDEL